MDTAWIDKTEYPFKSRYLKLPAGQMHYIDEGKGDVILLVHGTPSWSFEYRKIVKVLSESYRVIVPDHMGFGLSDKPENFGYKPEDHAKNLEQFIETLDLRNITMMVHDFGGPIGLNYAVNNPQNLKKLIVSQTWMWSSREYKDWVNGSKFMGSFVGKFLYKNMNFSPKVMVPQSFADKAKLTPEIHQHYIKPFAEKKHRHALWVLAKELVDSSEYYDSLWQKRQNLGQIPMLIMWAMKDKFFKPHLLEKWQQTLPHAKTVKLENSGHFVAEEAPDEVLATLQEFLKA